MPPPPRAILVHAATWEDVGRLVGALSQVASHVLQPHLLFSLWGLSCAAGHGAHGLGPVLRHAGQRAVLRVPVVEEKEAGERRLRLARQQLSQQANQLRVALLLGGPPRHAGDLEGVRVAAQHQQLVAAAKRHAGGHVEVPAHVAAGVVDLLVDLQQDVAPRGRQGKVREGVGRLRLQPAAAEGQVVLVLEGCCCWCCCPRAGALCGTSLSQWIDSTVHMDPSSTSTFKVLI